MKILLPPDWTDEQIAAYASMWNGQPGHSQSTFERAHHDAVDYEAPRDPSTLIRVRGVGRVADEPRAILVALSERPTDDEMRSMHDFLRGWRRSEADDNAIDILSAAVLWLRNHYDLADRADQAMRDKVCERIDSVLASYRPTVKGMERLREMYPVDIVTDAKHAK